MEHHLRRVFMKHRALPRSPMIDVEHSAGTDHHSITTVDWNASAPRQGRAVSEAMVCRIVASVDAVAILAVGVAAIHWDRSGIDWRLEGLVMLMGTLLGLNFLRLTGAHRFRPFGDLSAAVGRALFGWLLTLGSLFIAAFVFEPITATGGPR